jgi:uncharacterized membrane protein
MNTETQRIIKTFIYKLCVYFPITLILAYIFYRDFSKDLGFAGASVGVGIVLYYLFDWTWHHKTTNRKTCIAITTAWIIFLAIGFTATGVDASKQKYKDPPDKVSK